MQPKTSYTVHQLAELAGVSARTLRYYDELGLLPPAAVGDNGYRRYGPAQVAALQQILLYRRFGVPLKDIAPLLQADTAAKTAALQAQLQRLKTQRRELERLTENLQHTILELQGEYTMTDTERFAALKRQMLDENEAAYGAEIRTKYGADVVDAANLRLKTMSESDWQTVQALNAEIAALLPRCVAAPEDDALARQLAGTHRRWLCCYWPAGQYTPAAHRGLAALYRADERFAAYYDGITPGGCETLCRAIELLCAEG